MSDESWWLYQIRHACSTISHAVIWTTASISQTGSSMKSMFSILSVISVLLAQQRTRILHTPVLKKKHSWCIQGLGSERPRNDKQSMLGVGCRQTVILPLHPGGPDAAAGVATPGKSSAKRPQRSGYLPPFLSGLLFPLPSLTSQVLNLTAGVRNMPAHSQGGTFQLVALFVPGCRFKGVSGDAGWLLICSLRRRCTCWPRPSQMWCHAVTYLWQTTLLKVNKSH